MYLCVSSLSSYGAIILLFLLVSGYHGNVLCHPHSSCYIEGFSFGGLLACCVMANLWQESRISAEILLKQTTCITFGTPFMNIQLIDQVLRMFPDLKKCIHSIYLKEDLFPQIMGYVSLADSTQDKKQVSTIKMQEVKERGQVCT